MQGSDTKSDEVLLFMTRVPEEDLWESLYEEQLHYSEDLEHLMYLYRQDTVEKGEAASYSRLKEMVGSPSCGAEEKGQAFQSPR